jgi:hypothetical protein
MNAKDINEVMQLQTEFLRNEWCDKPGARHCVRSPRQRLDGDAAPLSLRSKVSVGVDLVPLDDVLIGNFLVRHASGSVRSRKIEP